MKFDLQPTHLHNERIRLIPLQETDFDRLFEVGSNPKVWEQHPNPNRYKLEDFTNYFKGALESNGAFLILDSFSNETIGCSRYYDYNEKDSTILIGYTFIGIKFWGNGYNKALRN